MNTPSRWFWISLIAVVIVSLGVMIQLGVTGFAVFYFIILVCFVIILLGTDNLGARIDLLRHPKATRLFNRGLHKQDQGDTEGAIADYQAALHLYPRLGLAEVNWGVILLRQQDYEGAFAHFTRAIETGQARAAHYAYYNRGLVYYHQGDFRQAIIEFTDSVRIQPRFTRAYLERGLVYLKQGNWDACIADSNKAISLGRPRSLMAMGYHNRASAYIAKNEFDLALTDCNQAIQLKPRSYLSYACRGEVRLLKGEARLAVADFKKAVDLQPDFTAGFAGLALAHQAAGDSEQAKQIWMEVVNKDEHFRDSNWLRVDCRWSEPLVAIAQELIAAADSGR